MFEGARVQQTDYQIYQFKRAVFLSKSELEVPIFGQIQLVPSHVFIQVWAYGPEIPLRSGQLHFEGRPGGKHPSPGAPRQVDQVQLVMFSQICWKLGEWTKNLENTHTDPSIYLFVRLSLSIVLSISAIDLPVSIYIHIYIYMCVNLSLYDLSKSILNYPLCI